MHRRLRTDAGFALPLTIFLVTLLTIMLATGFARVTADRRMSTGSEHTADALAVAQSGLQSYMGTATDRPQDGDSVRMNVPGGYAWVVARVLRNPADTLERQAFVLRSTGYVLEPTVSSEPLAQRTVAQLAYWQVGTIETMAAVTAPNGLFRRPQANLVISGNTTYCGGTPIAGLLTTTYVSQGPGNSLISGNPQLIEQPGNGSGIASATNIDWASTIGQGLVPDYTSFQHGDFGFPIQRIQGDLALGGFFNASNGLLIVTGDLRVSGWVFFFEGIILVGGRIRFDADQSWVHGLVISGLNRQLGQNPQRTEAQGDVTIQYNQCYINTALAALTGLAQVPYGWIDNWATY